MDTAFDEMLSWTALTRHLGMKKTFLTKYIISKFVRIFNHHSDFKCLQHYTKRHTYFRVTLSTNFMSSVLFRCFISLNMYSFSYISSICNFYNRILKIFAAQCPYTWSEILSSLLFAMLSPFKTKSLQKLFPSDCIKLYGMDD